uniref:chitin synthase n=1 Tax=Crassostrea virginica TaxID=6565 RepID=A0A8B8DQF7_CRAVI|nr:uncharacterized protein LOC111128616 [Crassostrea virginica]
MTPYIWRKGVKIELVEKIFSMPFYAGYAVDITLLWAIRRRRLTYGSQNNNDEQSSRFRKLFKPIISLLYTVFTFWNGSKMDEKHQTEQTDLEIPFIHLCATMWHESELEMKTLLRSIFRLNEYQSEETLKQYKKLKNSQKMEQRPNKTYFQFDAHIFFDDAFKENITKITEKTPGQKGKFQRHRGTKYNKFAEDFLRYVEETARLFYGVKSCKAKATYITPYGKRVEYTLLSPCIDKPNEKTRSLDVPCRLIIHFKDKFLIRNKKRWSQVMYMCYLLRYKPIAEGLGIEDTSSSKQEENKADPIEKQREKAFETFKEGKADRTFILALDGDVDFIPDAVERLLDRMLKNGDVGAACGRIIPKGTGPMVWYQKFEYAVSHWLQKATEHVFGCVLCSPGCFSLFRASALLKSNILNTYLKEPSTGLEHIQYDQGEDRLLSTLLLQKNFKLEYTAASDAYTYVPEGFFEFFNQRRRWAPSTLANIFKIIISVPSVTNTNKYISKPYLVYHMFLFASSLITPGTIFLMILGATKLAFPVIPTWLAFLINLSLVCIVIVGCMLAEGKTQLRIAAVISAIYSLMMVVVLFGLIIDAISSGFCSVTTYFFLYVAGIFFLAAVLHPREFFNIFYGALYFLAVPTTSMLLLVYALGNLHVTSWGTRESNKSRRRKKQGLEDVEDSLFCCGLFRCSCTPKIIMERESSKAHLRRVQGCSNEGSRLER